MINNHILFFSICHIHLHCSVSLFENIETLMFEFTKPGEHNSHCSGIIKSYVGVIPTEHRIGVADALLCSGLGVTKPIFSVPLFSTFSVIVKTNVSY